MAKNVAELIRTYAAKKVTPFSLRELFLHGQATGQTRIRNTRFLHRELPVRLAQRLQDLNHLPGGLTYNPNIQSIIRLYTDYFVSLTNAETPRCVDSERKYTELLEDVLEDRNQVILTIARGVLELRRDLGDNYNDQLSTNIKDSLNRFFMARTGLRFIMEQHIAGQESKQRVGYSGVIQEQCRPYDVINAAAEEAQEICDRSMGEVPEVVIAGDVDLQFTYVPTHMYYIVFELLKNALRATVEHSVSKGLEEDDFPPIEVIIARGKRDVTIKIADRGGGIPFTDVKKVWDFMFVFSFCSFHFPVSLFFFYSGTPQPDLPKISILILQIVQVQFLLGMVLVFLYVEYTLHILVVV
jgi:pyruvate dehydrogenase kinase 2/3/4